MSVFKPLSQLNQLNLAANRLSHKTLIPDFLPQLNDLILDTNAFMYFPKTCEKLAAFMPNLTLLDLSYNVLFSLPSASVCLPRLELFICLGCATTTFRTNAFGSVVFPSLKTVVFHSSNIRKAGTTIEKYAFNNTNLEFIALFESGADFATDSIHPDCFAGCPNLRLLYLSGNDFSSVSAHKLKRLLNHPHLYELGLGHTNIGHISAEIFTNIPNLFVIYLDSNKLSDIPDGVFDRLDHLVWLDMSSNRISIVRETAFSPTTRQRFSVDLGNNPFQCDCELRWFQHWFTTQPGVFTCDERYHPCTMYTCDNLPNTTVQSFYVADQACLWSSAVSKFIIATVILLMLPLTAAAVLYRYRWHIRLVLYEAVRGRGDRWRRLQEQDFRYDVFVSYDKNDLDWVRAHLMPKLEGRLGLRLCIHSRDFMLGAPIVENIEESVKQSKKIMMLFSKNFAHSHWCQFEPLQLCLTHVLLHGDALLVVLLEDIPFRDLTPAMMAVMKTVTYIEWGNEPEAVVSFWGRVQLALNEILP